MSGDHNEWSTTFLCFLTLWLKDIQGSFPSHGFKIHVATIAAYMGVSDHAIQAMGHWNSDAYIRTPAEALREATSLLSLWQIELVKLAPLVFVCC